MNANRCVLGKRIQNKFRESKFGAMEKDGTRPGENWQSRSCKTVLVGARAQIAVLQ